MFDDKVEISEKAKSGAAGREVTLATDELISDVVQLIAIVKRETEFLSKMKFAKAQELFEEKNRLIRKLEIKKQLIRARQGSLQGRTPEKEVALSNLFSVLERELQENFRAVRKAKLVNERIMSVITRSVEDQLSPGVYGKNKPIARPYANGFGSLTFNEKI